MASKDGDDSKESSRVSGGTYYQILDVAPNANSDAIKISYRRLALKLHPDKNRDDPNATERFQELAEAYEVLIDPERRQAYDQNSDFILRAFAEGGGAGEDGGRDSFLSVPSSRTFWCLMVDSALNDDGKSVTAYAQQLEDEIFTELLNGGVCGFTMLHFAAFSGKHRSVQALIELGANVNAKTQPLCVTTSQQFCRPTPLDLTTFVQNKRARELTQRALQAADGAYGGVDMAKLEPVWQGLIRHQLLLIREEVVKFTSKIPLNVRRFLRTEPRWREVIHFPGEDAASMERKRTKKAFLVWSKKLQWVVLGDPLSELKYRWYVRFWNLFVAYLSWWLFSFDKFQSLQAIMVSMLFMSISSLFRQVDPQEVWEKVPSREQLLDMLPPREQVEEWAVKAKDFSILAWKWSKEEVKFIGEEFGKLRETGFSRYAEEAWPRFLEWLDATVEWAKEILGGKAEEGEDGEGEEEEDERRSKRKQKRAGLVNKLQRLLAGKGGGGKETTAGAGDGPLGAEDTPKRPPARPVGPAAREAPRGAGRRRPRREGG